jgi:altronate dehydratase small subunit
MNEKGDRDSSIATDPRLLRLDPQDNVAVATTTLPAGESLLIGGRPVTLPDRVPTGHKLALVPIAAGEKIIKYGSPIGSATCDICPGDYVHTHNLKSDYLPTYTLDGSNPYLREDRKQ